MFFCTADDQPVSFEKVKPSFDAPEIVRIAINGKAQAKAPGKAVLTAETADGLKATCCIIVE